VDEVQNGAAHKRVAVRRQRTAGVNAMTIFAPAKLNLFLAVTGRRPDGFHDLVSLVAPLDFGDTLRVEPAETMTLECDDPDVPVDQTNLVLKAARAFVAATGWRGAANFSLEKRIPIGAGLGGGSSDAWAALTVLNTMAGRPLAEPALLDVAASVGSDCALFAAGGPVIMRGRGERLEKIPDEVAARMRGRRVLVFKPAFGIATAWAYARMAAEPAGYVPAADAEARLATWMVRPEAPAEEILFNAMERAAFAKHLALPALLDRLRGDFGLDARMSGSGSACFALLPKDCVIAPVVAAIRDAWGEASFVITAVLA
jgi:4-diphosphocytidyl-2-C-methyl-D-erythritol kinase